MKSYGCKIAWLWNLVKPKTQQDTWLDQRVSRETRRYKLKLWYFFFRHDAWILTKFNKMKLTFIYKTQFRCRWKWIYIQMSMCFKVQYIQSCVCCGSGLDEKFIMLASRLYHKISKCISFKRKKEVITKRKTNGWGQFIFDVKGIDSCRLLFNFAAFFNKFLSHTIPCSTP